MEEVGITLFIGNDGKTICCYQYQTLQGGYLQKLLQLLPAHLIVGTRPKTQQSIKTEGWKVQRSPSLLLATVKIYVIKNMKH